ncbi:MAG: HAD family hydrolase [Saprospiraceae bacterium]|nr:HAD family hydrolase [Saprospiraceae bacterium]
MAIKYIFFDCFNTLIDDFDEAGDESGMRPLAHIPVSHGVYDHPDHFHDDYLAWRRQYWKGGNQDEVLLADRLTAIFRNHLERSSREVDVVPVVEEMMKLFHQVFPTTIRRSALVPKTLAMLHKQVPMAVVSNFFLADYPAYLLNQHNLDHYFDFVIDSAQLMIKKPGRSIYLSALEKAKIAPDQLSEVLFIGDNLKNDVLIPLELGMQAWYFDRSGERKVAPAPPGIISFKNWMELDQLLRSRLNLLTN